MAEEETIFTSKVSYGGIFTFSEFYEFCYQWLTEETGLELSEDKYQEKIAGEAKEIEVKWSGEKKLTDYFKQKMEITFTIKGLTKVKIKQAGAEVDTNKGKVDVKVKGVLVKDYQSKFEMTAGRKFMRSVYEKFVIPSAVEEFKGRVASDCDEFLTQAKAFLDLEGRK